MDAIIRVIFERVGILYLGMIIFITSAAIVFLPENMQEQLMFQQIRADYGKFFGPLLILSGAYLVVAFISKVFAFIGDWKYRRDHKRFIIEKLENIDSDELSVLAAFYDPSTQLLRESALLDYFDRRVKLLEAYGIIIRLADSGICGMDRNYNMTAPMAYKLHSLARKHINGIMRIERAQEQQ